MQTSEGVSRSACTDVHPHRLAVKEMFVVEVASLPLEEDENKNPHPFPGVLLTRVR